MADKRKKKSVWKRIVGWFKRRIEWLEAHASDPAITKTLMEDLGLPPNHPMTPPEKVPDNLKGKLDGYLLQEDPDEAALIETLTALKDIYDTGRVFYESMQDQNISPWELFWLISQVWVVEDLRVRNPSAWAVCKALGMITGEYDSVERFDPGILVSTLKGDPTPPDYGEQIAQRWSALFGTLSVAAASFLHEPTHGSRLEAFYGWDPDPESTSPQADLVSARTGTMLLRFPGEPEVTLGLTALGVTGEQGGPGLFLAVTGELSATAVEGQLEWTATALAAGGAWYYIPFNGSQMQFRAGGPASALVRARIRQAPPQESGQPPPPGTALPSLELAITDGTRLELAGFELVVEVGAEGAGIRGYVTEGKLTLSLSDGDGFLANLPGKTIEVPFSIGVSLDTQHGLRIEGGTRLRATLPLSASLFGTFTLQYLELSSGPSPSGGFALELSAGMSLKLGPFRAAIDRIGILADSGQLPEDDFIALDRVVGVKPPSGIGLVLVAKSVKGGGYLYADPQRGEYAGVLELEVEDFPLVGKLSVKAIGLLTTKLPEGREGWALLLLLFAQFRVDIGWGFTFNGLGGVVGLHHATDPLAISEGLKNGIIDDLLFPENPVADAPRIIPRLRTVFPIETGTFTIGLTAELGWGTPTLAYLRLAVIFEIRNALGGGDADLARVVVLGQLLVQAPPKDSGVPPVVRLLVDIVGWYDFDEEWLFFRARLRDSKIAGFAVIGDLVVSVESADTPAFILAAGGFHPAFVNLPRGVPAAMDRLGFGFKLGPVKLELKLYYAVTPNTKQLGANIDLKATLGPVTIEGTLGFDALVDTETDRFLAQFRFKVAIKFKGHSLAGVKVEGTLEGPDEWHIVGSGSFEILLWDVGFDFDEHWGELQAVAAQTFALREAMAGAISDPANWSSRLPRSVIPPVTVEVPSLTGGSLAVHPLGEVAFLQRAAPLGIEVQRGGAKRVAGGPVTFGLGDVTVGGRTASAAPLREHFARGQFVDLDEERKLTGPSFERFDAGAAIGSGGYRVPSEDAFGRTSLAFEDRYLVPGDEPDPPADPRRRRWDVVGFGTRGTLPLDDLVVQARRGGAGQSVRRFSSLLAVDGRRRMSVVEPPLAVVDDRGLQPLPDLDGAPESFTAGEQLVAGRRGLLLVEATEVVD
jgi:hypothetical protein